jgi:hypothetical protein
MGSMGQHGLHAGKEKIKISIPIPDSFYTPKNLVKKELISIFYTHILSIPDKYYKYHFIVFFTIPLAQR